MKKAIVGVVVLAVLIVSPFYLLFGPARFDYDAADLRAAVEGTWHVQVAAVGSAPARDLTLTLRQGKADPMRHSERRHLIRDAAACGTRSLVRNAEACMDITEMPLEVAGAPDGLHAAAKFSVSSTTFERGTLELEIGDLSVEATVTPTGVVTYTEVFATPAPAVTLVRVTAASH